MGGRSRRACMCAVVEAIPLAGRVLDLGCGLGRLAIPLAALYPDVEIVAVDISPIMLAQAEASAAVAQTENVTFLQGDGRTLPDVGRIDAAYCVLLFQHLGIDAVRHYMGEVASVLVRGGRFVVQHVYAEHQPAFLSNAHSAETLSMLGELAGLRWIDSRRELVYPSWAWSVWEKP